MCESIDCNKVQVYDGHDDEETNRLRESWLKATGGRSITLGYHIVIGDDDRGSDGYVNGQTLAHEMTHVGQFENWGPEIYTLTGLATQAFNSIGNALGDTRNPAYQVRLPLTKPFDRYGMEQQATIVERCYLGVPEYCASSPYKFPGK